MCPHSSFLSGVMMVGTCAGAHVDPICLDTTLKIRWRHPERVCEEGRGDREDGGGTKAADPLWCWAGLLAKIGCGM